MQKATEADLCPCKVQDADQTDEAVFPLRYLFGDEAESAKHERPAGVVEPLAGLVSTGIPHQSEDFPAGQTREQDIAGAWVQAERNDA